MTRKKMALIIAAICLAAALGLAIALGLGRGGRPQSGAAKFIALQPAQGREGAR